MINSIIKRIKNKEVIYLFKGLEIKIILIRINFKIIKVN